jgi:hypothetical protein
MSQFSVGDYLKFKFVYVTCLRAQKCLLSQEYNGKKLTGKNTTQRSFKFSIMCFDFVVTGMNYSYPFNAGIKSRRATLPAGIFLTEDFNF